MEIETALEQIKAAVGPRGWIADPAEQEPYLVEARRLYRGATRLVVRPASTEEVAAVVRICAEARLPIVPQGGNTGLVGGSVPPEDGQNIVLALGRMNRVRAIDPVNFTMTVESGCILADLQQAAAGADRLFPRCRGELSDRRQSVDQRRRHRGAALWQYPRADPGPRGRIARRPRLGRAAGIAQGQYRLRSEAAFYRRRGHPRHHHRRDGQALSQAARGRDSVSR